MTTRCAVLPAILALLFAITPAAPGQCAGIPIDDGFDTGCCAPVLPVLPAFPSFVTTGEYGALLGCGQTFVIPPFAIWFSAPTYVLCDYALISTFIPLTSSDSISGVLIAKYSRTWIDLNSPVIGQVWRFLVNGDLNCVSAGGSIPACSTIFPRCASLNIPVHFEGHIDYSCDPSIPGGGFAISYSLNHLQGCISHSWFSCNPLTGIPGHDEYSYHIVGPSPFTFSPVTAPQGSLVSEAVRPSYLRLLGGFAYNCLGEAKIPGIVGSGILISQPPHCGCGVNDQCTGGAINCLPPTANCYAEQFIQGGVCCPIQTGFFQGFPVGNTPVSNTGFLSQGIGNWGGGTFFPGFGSLTIYFGVMTYLDPCNQVNWPIHAVSGVGTSNVFGQHFNTTLPPCGPSTQFGNAFIDLKNILMLNSVNLPPGYGCAHASDVVWNFTL